MANTKTPFLGLILSAELSAASKYNLNRIDSLGEIFRFADNGDTLITGDAAIKLSTEAGGAIELGNISRQLSEIRIFADVLDLNNATLINVTVPWSLLTFSGSSLTDIEDRSHTDLSDIGSKTHSEIDSHIADTDIHFVKTAISHTDLLDKGTNTHVQLDTHLASSSNIHGVQGSVVGTESTQTLQNKTLVATVLDADLNTITNIDNADIKAGAGIAQSKISGLVSDLAAKEPTVDRKNISGTSGRTVVTGGTGAAFEAVNVNVSTDLLPSPVAGDVGKVLLATGADTTEWTMVSVEDKQVGISATDSSPGYLEAKLLAGDAVSLTKALDPGNSTLTIANTDKGSSAVTTHLSDVDHDPIVHSNRSDLDLVSGTNTGDEDKTSIETKLGAAATDNDGYLSSTDWDTFNGKEDALGFTPANIAGDTFTGLVTLDNLGLQLDTVGAEPVAPSKGQLWWDSEAETVSIKMAGTAVELQVGQESYVRALNDTGSTLEDGVVVYISGVASDTPTIALAQADAAATSDGLLGVVTEDILDGATGYVTIAGLVRGIKTDFDCDGAALAPGDLLYLCSTVPGGVVKTVTTSPDHQVKIGTVIKAHATEGIILVRIEIGQHLMELHDVLLDSLADRDIFEYDATAGVWKNFINPNTITKEPTGFADPTNTGVAYDSTARTITLTHSSGTIVYYVNGVRYTKSSPFVSDPHDEAEDFYFLAMEGATATWSTEFPGFDNGAYVAYVNYGATDKYAIRECHGLMPWQAWEELHLVVGTYRISGGAVIAGSWAAETDTVAAVTPAVDEMLVRDEDLPTTIPTGVDGATYTRVHFDSGLAVFTTGSTFPYPSSGGNPQYNENPASGTALTTLNSGNAWFNVYCLFVPVTSDAGSQVYRHLWLTGQQIYATLALAQAEDFRSLNLGNLAGIFPEILPFVRVSYQRANSFTTTDRVSLNASSITYLAGTRSALVSVAGFTPTDHSALTGRSAADQHPASAINNNPSGNLEATEVQAALNELQGDIDLRALATAAATRYAAALSWTGAGPYTMTIAGATHGKGVNPVVTVRQTETGVSSDVLIESIQVSDATGDVVLTSTEEITGKVIII